jgi:parallel beta-helix repeat protein
VENNDIFGSVQDGVRISSSGNPTLRRNRIHDGKQSGVYVVDNGIGTVEDNEIFGNAHAGVRIRSGGNPTIRRNVVSKNFYEAVWITSGGRGEIVGNDLRGNARGAFDIAEDCKVGVTLKRNQEDPEL